MKVFFVCLFIICAGLLTGCTVASTPANVTTQCHVVLMPEVVGKHVQLMPHDICVDVTFTPTRTP